MWQKKIFVYTISNNKRKDLSPELYLKLQNIKIFQVMQLEKYSHFLHRSWLHFTWLEFLQSEKHESGALIMISFGMSTSTMEIETG